MYTYRFELFVSQSGNFNPWLPWFSSPNQSDVCLGLILFIQTANWMLGQAVPWVLSLPHTMRERRGKTGVGPNRWKMNSLWKGCNCHHCYGKSDFETCSQIFSLKHYKMALKLLIKKKSLNPGEPLVQVNYIFSFCTFGSGIVDWNSSKYHGYARAYPCYWGVNHVFL